MKKGGRLASWWPLFDNTKMPLPKTVSKWKGLLAKALGRMGGFGVDGKVVGTNGKFLS